MFLFLTRVAEDLCCWNTLLYTFATSGLKNPPVMMNGSSCRPSKNFEIYKINVFLFLPPLLWTRWGNILGFLQPCTYVCVCDLKQYCLQIDTDRMVWLLVKTITSIIRILDSYCTNANINNALTQWLSMKAVLPIKY